MKDTLFFIISEKKKANNILTNLHQMNIKGGTVMKAEGLAPPGFLSKIGLDKKEKELLMLVTKRENEDKIISLLIKKYHFDQKNTGIGFSMPLIRYNKEYLKDIEKNYSSLFCLFVILEKGQREKINYALKKSGQYGATLIKGRGAGVPHSLAFDFFVEKEKDIILMLTSSKDMDKLSSEIGNIFDIHKKGSGFMFSIPLRKTVGLEYRNEFNYECN